MTITINIKPETEAELARQAEVHGMDVPAYAARVREITGPYCAVLR